jgi:hypothetical protein
MVIKNRKCELYKVSVPMFWKTSIDIYVTPKQLAKLNSIPVGKELFLSRRYCQLGGGFWAIRTRDGLQYMPNPYSASDSDVALLREAYGVCQ